MLRLKTMRTQAGISQAQFAKDMGVAQNTVSNWENENRTLDAETLSRVADYFHVSVDYLLGKTERPGDGRDVCGGQALRPVHPGAPEGRGIKGGVFSERDGITRKGGRRRLTAAPQGTTAIRVDKPFCSCPACSPR